MLRTRSRSKQGLMSDSQSLSSSTDNMVNKPTASSLFPSPRLFRSFSSRGFADNEAAMSPTSILEIKQLSSFGNLLYSDRLPKKPPFDATESKPIGLGIVDALSDEKDNESCKPDRRMVLFGSQLKIQIPSISSNSSLMTRSMEVPNSPIEFGIKNKDSQLALFSPARRSLGHDEVSASLPRVFTGSISMSEMELSEEYTCVISHGPNPKTTHIFDNCIVESNGDVSTAVMMETSSTPNRQGYPSDDFLTFCHSCKKNLGQGKDIYMYRGEKAFCSSECRYHEMLIDEELDNQSTDSSLTI